MHLFKRFAAKDYDAALANIPVLDCGPTFRGERGALETLAAELRRACEEVGFFYVKNHGVPEDLIARTFEQSRRFHTLPEDEKLKVKINANNIGYMPLGQSLAKSSTVHKATKPNQNASFFFAHERSPEHPDVIKKTPLRGMNQWPENLAGFRETMLEYFKAVHALGERLLPPIAASLGLPLDFFTSYFTGETHANVRCLHYPPTRLGDNEFGTAPHTDNSFITFLARTEVPGLAVRLTSGEWVPPPLIDGTYLVNLGNFMKRWSNDRYLSTPHGVIVEGDADRYSVAFFFSPGIDKTIESMPTCVSADNPSKYPPALIGDLVREYYQVNFQDHIKR